MMSTRPGPSGASRPGAPIDHQPRGRIATAARDLLERRAAARYPSTSLAVADAVALGIAGQFSSSTPSGRVFERLCRTCSADSDELLEAARRSGMSSKGPQTPEGTQECAIARCHGCRLSTNVVVVHTGRREEMTCR